MASKVSSTGMNQKQRIMIIENENNLSTLYREELEEEGYEIRVAKNEKKAITMLRNYTPDLIITEFFKSLTTSHKSFLDIMSIMKYVPVIIYTGFPRSFIDIPFCKTRQYLLKSSNLDGLKEEIKNQLTYRRFH